MIRLAAAAIAALIALPFALPSLAAEPSDLAGQWVLNQLDGRGGKGCLMELASTEVEGGALKLELADPSMCPEMLGAATNWYMDGQTLIFADDADTALLKLVDHTRPDEVMTWGDADGVYYLERL